jgi:hypothetical protein
MADCDSGHYKTSYPDPWDEDYSEQEWVSACRWKAVTTFRDICTTCGKTFEYTNTHNYSEEIINAICY